MGVQSGKDLIGIVGGSEASVTCKPPPRKTRKSLYPFSYIRMTEAGAGTCDRRSRSGKNLPPHRPKKAFDRGRGDPVHKPGRSYRQIAHALGLGVGTVVRTL